MGKGIEMNGMLTGKRGGNVYSRVGGVQISRAYNPTVANPNTAGQVNQRSKFKLASQLAANLAGVIVIRKKGLQSSRNLFVKRNIGSIIVNQGTSQITLDNVQLTDGVSALPQVTVSRTAEALTVALAAAASPEVSRVVYSVFQKNSEGSLQLAASAIEEVAGAGSVFSHDFALISGELVIYAYGIKDADASATAKFGNMMCESGVDIARLVAARQLNSADYSFTATRGATLAADGSSIQPTPAGSFRVFVTASGNGTVSGAGTYADGASVTVTATPASGATFLGWKENPGVGNIDTGQYLSTSASYTFTIDRQMDLVAYFHTAGGNGGSTDPDDGDE